MYAIHHTILAITISCKGQLINDVATVPVTLVDHVLASLDMSRP